MTLMELLSIQSSVAFGHVGNSAAVFPLQRLGIEAWAVNTVHFSNHTGYGEWRGPLLSADDLRAVIQGVEERGALARVAAVLSGYQGAEEVGQVVLDTVARVKELNPSAVYCCDPVMGDVGRGMFVRPGIPEFMRDRVVPAADVITPNHFELDFLSGRETRTVAEVLDAVDAVRAPAPAPCWSPACSPTRPRRARSTWSPSPTTAPGPAVRRCCRSPPTGAVT